MKPNELIDECIPYHDKMLRVGTIVKIKDSFAETRHLKARTFRMTWNMTGKVAFVEFRDTDRIDSYFLQKYDRREEFYAYLFEFDNVIESFIHERIANPNRINLRKDEECPEVLRGWVMLGVAMIASMFFNDGWMLFIASHVYFQIWRFNKLKYSRG